MDSGFALTVLGLMLVVGAAVAYFGLLFVVHGFTYRTWMFHTVVLAGMGLATFGWLAGGSGPIALVAVVIGVVWFVVAWHELRLVGSTRLSVRPGDAMPPFAATTTDGTRFTEQDLVAHAPALLVLYRGWWCPSSKVQLDEILDSHGRLADAGLTVFAGSVDPPAQA
jgi:hypothetical protein